MGKLERTVLWIIIALLVIVAIHNFVEIKRNKNIIQIIGETQSYIVELIK
ncbi:hypothetical protein ES705_32294 [subsurface metagenome]